MSSGNLEPVPDIVVWVDTTLRGNVAAISQPANRTAAVPFNTMGSFVEGPAGAIDIPEMERRSMSLAEREQCALDDFWGMVANQVEQAEATAAMEREDQRSHDIRARIKKEERYTLWEQEDLRKRETRSVVKENLEDAARREYLEIFYSAPSVDMAMNYTWPTRASLGQAWGQQSSDPLAGDTDMALTLTNDGGGVGDSSRPTTCDSGGIGDVDGDGDDSRSPLSTTQASRDVNNDWSTGIGSGDTGEESSSTLPFHAFRGKKIHQIVPVNDCFVPPRHISEPTTKNGFLSVLRSATAARLGGDSTSPGPDYQHTASIAPSGISKAVHLPPMVEVPRDGRPAAGLTGSNAAVGVTGNRFSFNKRPLTGEARTTTMSSFERKLATRRAQWSREAEAEAEERAFREQLRAQELLRGLRGFNGGGGGGDGGSGGMGERGYSFNVGASSGFQYLPPGDSCRGDGGPRRNRRRRIRGCGWRNSSGDCREGDGNVTELVPEREEQLLTQMFGLLDARNRGEVRLDEVLFYMTENAQVKSVLKQVTLWTLTKTRRWEWVEELLAAQPGRTLTLPALLAFSRSLHEESRVPRKHLRIAKELRDRDIERRDFRSRRLLPTDLVEGSEVEALFRKGFDWYRAWIVRCHQDDTFDVRFTRPPVRPSDDTPPVKGVLAAQEQRPEVDTSSQVSGSEEEWDNTDGEENSTLAAEEEWKATCDSVARFIGIPPDLGETERELLERAFDALAGVAQQDEPVRVANEVVATSGVDGENGTTATTSSEQPSHDGKGVQGVQQTATRRPKQQQEQPGRTNDSGGGGGGDKPSDAGSIEAPRILPSEIIRLLRAGAVEEYRRASPALSAACIYQEFAEGLEGAAAAAEGTRGNTRSSLGGRTDEDNHLAGEGEARRRKHDEGRGDCVGHGRQRWGISKEEFCDYFEAVTDLVDLNGLSLVPPVNKSPPQPEAVR